jgi:hypothetical protein
MPLSGVDPGGHAVRRRCDIAGLNPTEGVNVRLLCLLCVVKVAAFAMSWSLIQRSPTLCVCVCVYVCV